MHSIDRIQLLARQGTENTATWRDQQDAMTRLGTLERLQSMMVNLNRISSVQQRLDMLLHAALGDLDADHGTIYLSTPDEHTFVIGATYPPSSTRAGSAIAAQGGYVDAVAQIQCPVLIADLEQEGLLAYPGAAYETEVKSALAVPFIIGGRTVGILAIESQVRTKAFSQDDLNTLSLLCNCTAGMVDHARLHILGPESRDVPSLETWQHLVEQVPFAMLWIDPQHHQIWANQAFCQMTQFTLSELRDMPTAIHAIFPQDMPRASAGHVQELALPCHDGTRCPVQATLFDLNGERSEGLSGYLGIFFDQRERLALQKKLFHLQRLSNVGALLSAIAHELNNPLTAVIGFAELIMDRDDIPAEARQDLETIVSHAERSVYIVRDLLDYVRQKPQDATQLEITCQISFDLADDLPHVLGDARQIQQVLLNLINNAEQACATIARSTTLWIRTGMVCEGQHVRITIQDNGPGIAPQARPRIFESFFTTKAPGKGTGLGLCISKEIIESHKGRIWFETELDKGTTFFIELPACDRCSEQRQSQDPPVQSLAQPSSPSARILVVDDEKSIGCLIAKILTKDGHQVDVAWDGNEALQKLAGAHYDVVFLDLKLPGAPGQVIYDWIKREQADLACHTVILTGDTLGTETNNFLVQEHVRHLLKPFQLHDLRRAMLQVWVQ
jgi:signal transduction histidine kinase/putative methionine-R-sulfoxide reductase with GAF domain